MNMKDIDGILGRIYSLATDYLSPKEFHPGIDPVLVSGAVLYPEDVVSVVKTLLDWVEIGNFPVMGKASEVFEDKIKKRTGTRHVVLCNSGSSANLLALIAMKDHYRIKNEGQVITCATGFPTTVAPIIQNGLIPHFIDIDPETLSYDIGKVCELLEQGFDGIILAHTMGFPFDVATITEYAHSLGKFVIEDCCDALGAEIYNKPVGSFGDISTLSFYPAHHVSTGEGGSVQTKDGKIFRLLQQYANWGKDCWCNPGKDNTCGKRFEWKWPDLPEGWDHKYTFTKVGYNLKMTDLQAALGASQMEHDSTQIRQFNFLYLRRGLSEFSDDLGFVEYPKWVSPSPFGFPITVKTDRFTRNELVQFLENRKIGTRPVFAGNIVRHPMMKNVYYGSEDLSGSNYVMERTFWVGCGPKLIDAHLDWIIESVSDFIKKKNE